MSWFKIIETGKVSNTIIIIAVATSGTLLFASQSFIAKLKLEAFLKNWGTWVGIAFLVSSIFLGVVILGWIWRGLSGLWYAWRYKSLIAENVRSMDPDEQAIIREFIFNAKNTIALPLTNPSVVSLINKRIIYQAGSHGGMTYGEICFNYSISSKARKMLRLSMIGLPDKDASDLNQAEKDFINNNRPLFITKYSRW